MARRVVAEFVLMIVCRKGGGRSGNCVPLQATVHCPPAACLLTRFMSIRTWRHFLILTLLLLVTVTAATASPAGARVVTGHDPDPRFGAVSVFWEPEKAAALDLGWERILFYWSEIQPDGPDDWNTLHVMEEWLREADAQGREVVGLIKNTPPWATDDVPYGGVPRGLYEPPDDPDNLWAVFVRRLVTYYSERGVHRWIIWNEPDIETGVYGNEWAGDIEDYYRLLKVAYTVIKEVDPEATVHLAGLTYWHDVTAGREQYLHRFLEVATADPEAAAHGYFFDVISLHIYFRVETVASIVREMDAIQQSFGMDKPIWINETNAAPTLDPEWPVDRPQFQIDLEQQAWYIVQAHALGFAAGAQRMGVYKLTDVHLPEGGESFGLLRPDLSARPGYYALQTVVDVLSGFREVQMEESALYYVVTFRRPQGVTRILWARRPEAVTLSLPATTGEATLVQATGETAPLAAEEGAYTLILEGARCYDLCLVGGPPVIIVEEVVPDQEEEEATATPTWEATEEGGARPTITPPPSPTTLPTATVLQASTATPFPTLTPPTGAAATQVESGRGNARSLRPALGWVGAAAALMILLFLLVKFGRRLW